MTTPLRSVAHVMRRFTKAKWGGTETVVHNMARHLESKGVTSPIYCTSMLDQPGKEIVDGVALTRHRYTFPWWGLSEEDRHQLELKGGSPVAPGIFTSLLKQPDLDLIHTHVQLRLGGMARTAARLRGIPYVVSIHGGMLTTPQQQIDQMKAPFEGKLEWGKVFGAAFGSRSVLKDASAIICVGADEQKLMQEKFPNIPVKYIPNGVHVSHYRSKTPDAFRQHVGTDLLPPDAPYVLCVSRIDYQKNQLLLIKAFAAFSRSHPEHRLVLIGPVTVEAYEKEIRKTALAEGIENRLILIPGFPPGDPLLVSAFAGTEMFVLPTDHEPFGIVILEAWAAGIPVIASRVGGIPGFTTHEKNILLTPPKDADALAETMSRLSDHPDLRNQLKQAGQTEVESYDWSTIGDRTLDLYTELVEQNRGKS